MRDQKVSGVSFVGEVRVGRTSARLVRLVVSQALRLCPMGYDALMTNTPDIPHTTQARKSR